MRLRRWFGGVWPGSGRQMQTCQALRKSRGKRGEMASEKELVGRGLAGLAQRVRRTSLYSVQTATQGREKAHVPRFSVPLGQMKWARHSSQARMTTAHWRRLIVCSHHPRPAIKFRAEGGFERSPAKASLCQHSRRISMFTFTEASCFVISASLTSLETSSMQMCSYDDL